MNILILCTGNSCRSQMAQGFLQSFSKTLSVFSAGTEPAKEVHPLAVKTMAQAGIASAECPRQGRRLPGQRVGLRDYRLRRANESCALFFARNALVNGAPYGV